MLTCLAQLGSTWLSSDVGRIWIPPGGCGSEVPPAKTEVLRIERSGRF